MNNARKYNNIVLVKKISNKIKNDLTFEKSIEFERETRDIALSNNAESVLADMNSILHNSNADMFERYTALYVLHTYYRRMKDLQRMLSLHNEFIGLFRGDSTIGNFKSLQHMELEQYTLPHATITLNVLDNAREAINGMELNHGAYHLFASLVAKYYEDVANEELTHSDRERLEEAVKAMQYAISLEQRSRFFFTLARLYGLLGNYDKAKDNLQQAINLEHSEEIDYALRIAEYYLYQVRFEKMELAEQHSEWQLLTKNQQVALESKQKELEQYIDDLAGKQKEVDNKLQQLNESQIKNIELLGFFAAIISFTIGGINIISNSAEFSFIKAAGLIIILMGMVAVTICILSFILHIRDTKLSFKTCISFICVFIFCFLLVLLGLGIVAETFFVL